MSETDMRVLLVGIGYPTHIGAFFRRALEQLGHETCFVDYTRHLKHMRRECLLHRIAYRALGRRPVDAGTFNERLVEVACRFRPHVVLVTMGMHIATRALAAIKAETGAILINYSTDDPFGPLNSRRPLVRAIPYYDIYATPRRSNIADLRRAGCRNPVFVRFGYDPAVHFPELPASGGEGRRWASDVVFVGAADRDRLPYFEAVARHRDIRLHLYGPYWGRYPRLRGCWRGLAGEREYRLALGGSRIAPCLVRRKNRDGHVMRTFEVPACAGFMLAERTEEHLELFEEGREMVCFGSSEELLDKVRYYLAHDEERARIAAAAYGRVTGEPHTYRDRIVELLKLAEAT